MQKFDANGHFVTHFGSYGVGLGQFGGSVPIGEYGIDFGPGIGPGPIGPTGLVVNKNPQHVRDRNTWGADIYIADCDNNRILVFHGNGMAATWGSGLGESIVFRPRQLSLDSGGRLYVSGLHKHEPPAATSDLSDPLKWRIEREFRWVSVFDNSRQFIGWIGSKEAHEQMKHCYGAGLHKHGFGLCVNKSDDSIVYVQGDNLIFKYRVSWPKEESGQ